MQNLKFLEIRHLLESGPTVGAPEHLVRGGMFAEPVFQEPGFLVGPVVAVCAPVGLEGLAVFLLQVSRQPTVLQETLVAQVASVGPMKRRQ